MKYRNRGKILLTAAVAAATVALSANLLSGTTTDQANRSFQASTRSSIIPAASTLAFDSSAGRIVLAQQSQQRNSAPSGSTPVFALEVDADGPVTVSTDRATESASMVRVANGGDLYPRGRALPPAEKAAAFLERHGAIFGISDVANELRIVGMDQDQYGNSRITYQQMHGDVPVFGGVMHGHVSKDGRLTAVNGKYVADVNLPTVPTINKDFAAESAIASVSSQLPSKMKNADLDVASTAVMVYRENLTKGAPGANHLAYQVEVTGGNSIREFVYVDAISGKIVDQISGIHGTKERRVHEISITLPPVWQEGQPRETIVNPAVEDEAAGAGESYNFFFNLSGGSIAENDGNPLTNPHRSWDGNNAEMITVNNDPTIVCPNAQWNGTSTNYCTGTSSDDVVTHEWGHAYTQETSGLIYAWQSGALNESYSDIWGETVDLLNDREFIAGASADPQGNTDKRSSTIACSNFDSQTPTGDLSYKWLMGEDAYLFAALPPVGDAAIRDMWHPSCFGDPDYVNSSDYTCSAGDAGGVHSNSSINNRAYALLVDGDTVSNSSTTVTVNGIGLTKAAHIFWRANSVYNTPASNFADNADALEMACQDLVGQPLTELVSDSEKNAPGLGGRDTVDPITQLSAEVITANDCAEVTAAIEAVEMRFDVTRKCGFTSMLDPAPAPMCGNAEALTFFSEDWESGQGAWLTGQEGVTKSTLDTLPWTLRDDSGWVENGKMKTMPENRDGSPHTGSVMYQENRRDLGNCTTDDESGKLWLESPEITVHPDDPSQLMFEHYVNTEINYDGGNVMISINDGNYQVIPASAFVHNAYSSALSTAADQNTNPKEGESAWTGGNQGEVSGDWGQSQIDLAAAGVVPGDRIKLRFDFGQDGCNGNDGWYVDQVELFTCGSVVNPPPENCATYDADVDLVNGSVFSIVAPSVTTADVSGENAGLPHTINVRNLTGEHTYMGDLTFELEGPDGTSITLFDGDACGADAWSAAVEFDDAATDIISCLSWAGGGEFQPVQALAAFDGKNPNGEWTLTVSDSFPQDEGRVNGWGLEVCTPNETDNEAPTANDDSETTDQNEPVTIDVLANDSDPENDPLTVDSVTMPANGLAFVSDNMVSYEPNLDFTGIDSFQYSISDGHDNTASATVTVTVYPVDPEDEDGDRAKGSGKLNSLPVDDDDDSSDDDSSDDDIDFHFDPKRKSDGEIKGHLHLKDKDADVKIHMKDIYYFGPVQGNCGMIDSGDTGTFIIEFRGTGKFEQGDTKIENAEFKACAVDADAIDGKKGNTTVKGGEFDRFHLECIKDTCDYNTDDRILDDDVMDKGNVQVRMEPNGSGGGAAPSGSSSSGGSSQSASAGDNSASTVFLEPALLSESAAGEIELFKINVYDADLRPAVGRAVSLNQTAPDGSQITLQGVTGLTGAALFNVVISPTATSFDVSVDGVSSNGIDVQPLLK